MADGLRIEVTRGGAVESAHEAVAVAVDADGASVLALGDTEALVYPRSAVKVLQALPLVESGAADACGFGDRELALACASHSGEAGHVALAGEMLARADLAERHLECGCHWPFEMLVSLALAREGGEPTPLHNNCSGKHAGFLCTAVHLGEDPAGYVGAGHPVQRRVRDAIAATTGFAVGRDGPQGVDGCAIPTYAAPLARFAHAFAKLAGGVGVEPGRAAAGRRLIEACMREPWLMAGTGRACVSLMEAAPGRVFAKTGAEGVFCGAIPELGFGFAVKAGDGATRAAESAVAALIARLLAGRDDALAERYAALSRKPLRNWNGTEVGEVRVAGL